MSLTREDAKSRKLFPRAGVLLAFALMVTAASERARGGKNNLRGLVISRVSESEGSESFAAGNVMDLMRMMMVPMLLGGAMIAAHAAAADPFAGLDSSARAKTNNAADPFADLEPAKSPLANTNRVSAIPVTDGAAAKRGFFGENFTFKNEIMAEFSYSAEANRAAETDGTLADLVHQSAMYYEDRLKGSGFSRVILSGASAAGAQQSSDIDELRRSLEDRLRTPVETVDPRTAAALTDRITAAPALLDALAPLVGLLLRDHAEVKA